MHYGEIPGDQAIHRDQPQRWWDKFTPIEETMAALDSLVTSGKARYIGFSNTPGWK